MNNDHREENRHPATWWQAVNPVWLAGDAKRDVAWPQIWWLSWVLRVPGVRWVCWFTRNPFCNAFSVIIGISHRSRTVYYAQGVGWTYADRGLNYGYSIADGSRWRLPFISYRGRWFEACLGWGTSGAFTPFTIRAALSKQPQTAS